MFCHKCGSQSLEGSVFCQKCGEKLIVDEPAPLQIDTSNWRTIYTVPGIISIPPTWDYYYYIWYGGRGFYEVELFGEGTGLFDGERLIWRVFQ